MIVLVVLSGVAATPYTWSPCSDVDPGTFDLHSVTVDPEQLMIGCPLSLQATGVAGEDVLQGTTATIGLSFMGMPLPLPESRRTVDVCALSHECPMHISSEEQSFGLAFPVPDQAFACPIGRGGQRLPCYDLRLEIRDQEQRPVTCVQAQFAIATRGKCI